MLQAGLDKATAGIWTAQGLAPPDPREAIKVYLKPRPTYT